MKTLKKIRVCPRIIAIVYIKRKMIVWYSWIEALI